MTQHFKNFNLGLRFCVNNVARGAKFEFFKIFEPGRLVVKCTCKSDVTKVIKLERAALQQSHCSSSNLCCVLSEIP